MEDFHRIFDHAELMHKFTAWYKSTWNKEPDFTRAEDFYSFLGFKGGYRIGLQESSQDYDSSMLDRGKY